MEDIVAHGVRDFVCHSFVRALVNAHRFHEGVDCAGPSLAATTTVDAWKLLVGILCVLRKGNADLLEVGLAGSAACVFTYLLKDGEQNCG